MSYLAGSQFERAKTLEGEIAALTKEKVTLAEDTDPVQSGSLVHLQKQDHSTEKFLLLSLFGAGETVSWQGKKFQVVSPHSPLGQELMHLLFDEPVTINKAQWFIAGHR